MAELKRLKVPEGIEGVSMGTIEYEIDDDGFITLRPEFADHEPTLTAMFAAHEHETLLKSGQAQRRRESTTAGQLQTLADYLMDRFGIVLADAMVARQRTPQEPVAVPVTPAPRERRSMRTSAAASTVEATGTPAEGSNAQSTGSQADQ